MARVFISHSSRDDEPATRIKAWLQEQGFETPFLDFDKHGGIPPGADWEKTLYREIEQSEAIIIIQTPNWLDSKWCFAEYTQARALGKAIFPIIETPTGETLIAPDIQALDLLKDREGGLEQLAGELTRIALDAQGGFFWDSSRPPYPGLHAFQEEDAALYFGRDDDIRRLIERINARRAQGGTKLIALLGASGSGKSSLLRAGVIPRIKRDKRNWIILPPMRPQAHPVDELARVIAIALKKGADWRSWRDQLNGPDLARTLSDLASDLRMQAEANDAQVLIPIDQGEELFGASEPDDADRFFTILNVAMSEDLPYLAVLAQRSDFLEKLQSAEKLTARFEEFSLPPLPLSRIPQIIEGPARVAGLGIDDSLILHATKDAETEDALPLLAFALRELFDRYADDNYLSLDEYHALGDPKQGLTPLENAVRKAADDVLTEARPGEEELTALREAFVPAMVRVNDKGEYVRQPAQWDELPAKAHPLLERLARARLLVISQEGEARMVEVAHEALLRKWPRLREWLDDAREFLTGRQQLERDLHDWQRASEAEKTTAMLTGLKLNRARGWLAERPHQLTVQERAYIQASIDHADAEIQRRQAEQERRVRDAEALAAAHRKTAQRTRIGLVVVALLALVITAAMSFTVWTIKVGLSAGNGLTALAVRAGLRDFPAPAMVDIEAGSFKMGSPETEEGRDHHEGPQHEVIVPAFKIGKTEVTFSEYDLFAQATERKQPTDENWGRETRPVINVSWDDAVVYTKWLSAMTGKRYRLPTEAEWEYAARAKTTTVYWWGNDIKKEDGKPWAHCKGCGSKWDGKKKTWPVGRFDANEWGLHDTAGNVWEWVQDCRDAPVDGSAREEPKCMVRGGAWITAPDALRSAYRDGVFNRDARGSAIGFRVAQDK